MTLPPLTYPTRNADRLKTGRVLQVQSIGIDDLGRVADFAAKRDGEPPDRRAKSGPGNGYRDLARQAQVPHAVRRLGQLSKESARRLEGPVDVPKRAGAAIAGELQVRGGVALGDRACLIDAYEEERQPLRTRTLHGRKPMRDLFQRGTELARQAFQVISMRARRVQKPAIGQ